MTRSIDPRRPRSLTDNQLAEVKRHPEVRLLLRVRNSLAERIRVKYGTISRTKGTRVYDLYQQAHRQHQSKKKAVQKALMAQVKAIYRRQQPVADIERQLGRPSVKQQEDTASESEVQGHLSEERRRAVGALFTFATSDPAEGCKRRSEAINAVTALSKRQELPVRKVCRPGPNHRTGAGVRRGVEADPADEVKTAREPFPMECLPTQCIFCLGQTELSLELRVKAFHSPGDLKKHFHRKHLRHYPDGEPITCPHPLCDANLNHKMHLQNHAETVHKTFT